MTGPEQHKGVHTKDTEQNIPVEMPQHTRPKTDNKTVGHVLSVERKLA